MHKNHIAFDLDGCLVNILEPIKRLLLEMHNIELKDDDPKYNQFDLVKATGLSDEELWKIFRMVYKEIESTPIYPGVTELLAKLYERTNEPPLILTARPPDAANDTYAIVERLAKKTPFSLILKHPRSHKAEHLKGYYFYVEDRRRTALELCELKFAVLLVRKNYNYIPDIDKIPNIFYIDGVHNLIPHIDYFTSNGNKASIKPI